MLYQYAVPERSTSTSTQYQYAVPVRSTSTSTQYQYQYAVPVRSTSTQYQKAKYRNCCNEPWLTSCIPCKQLENTVDLWTKTGGAKREKRYKCDHVACTRVL